ncbi:MAG TPA: MFS transporter [Rhodanobacter sp.]|nr:MFS transporter [Rhodanobacter sp.]
MNNKGLRAAAVRWFGESIEAPLEALAGGRARLKIIVLLASVLALNSADTATVGAVAVQLKTALDIDNVQVGLLVTASTAVGALVTLPFGVLADRINRSRVLMVAIVVWSLAMLLNGLSNSYLMLLLSRLLLGCIAAAASPIVVSLTGDFFRPGERGRIFGYILAGELLGVAIGFLLSGNLAALLSWRAAFWMLAAAGLTLAWVIWRHLPEPARGGQSIIPEGADEVPMNMEDAPRALPRRKDAQETHNPIARRIAACKIRPHDTQILHHDPTHMRVWQAVRYALSVRTFRSLVIASALGYFYFTGLRTFALIYMRETFGLGQAMASTLSVVLGSGAIVGVLLAGRLGDRLIRQGTLTARVQLGGWSLLLAAGALVPGLLLNSLYLTAPLFFIAAMGLGGANPSLDAARLDVMPSGLWGRAEGMRATVRFALSAAAPPLFGYVASLVGHPQSPLSHVHHASGLRVALLVMLVALVAAGLVLLLRAVHTYPRDTATSRASERATRKQQSR